MLDSGARIVAGLLPHQALPFDRECIAYSGFGRLINDGELTYGEPSEEHDLPLVRWRRRGRGPVLREDFSRFIRRIGAPRPGRLSLGKERGCVDGRVYRNGHSLPRAQWRTHIQA